MQYYNEDFFNIQDNYQSIAAVFVISIVSLAACGTLIYKTCKINCGFVSRKKSRYKSLGDISLSLRGKNQYTKLVFSRSLRDDSKKDKIWFYKPVFFSNYTTCLYNLEAATREVYFGTLIAELLGKEFTAKTKFNLYDVGVISRVIGDDTTKVIDLFNFCVQQRTLPPEAQQHLLKVVILGIILGNRDLRLENLVVKLSQNDNADFVYAIDHEFGGSRPLQDFRTLIDVLDKIVINPKQIIHLLMDKTFKWNYVVNKLNFSQSVFDLYANTLLSSITAQACLDVMEEISRQLAANNFNICLNIKQKILSKLEGHEYAYPRSDIEATIIPTIDRSIESVFTNVKITKQFLESRYIARCTLQV